VLSGKAGYVTEGQRPGDGAGLWYPRAVGDLDWSEMDGAFILSRPDGDHVLNQTGALLLELANGQHSVEEMIEIVREAFRLEHSPEREVRDFLDQAITARLVE
jgi:hypothetical protein